MNRSTAECELPGPRIRSFADEMQCSAWPRFLGHRRLRRLLLLASTLLTIGIDYLTGPTIRFPAFFALPIIVLAWYDGLLWGSGVGVFIILARFSLERCVWPSVPWPLEHSLMNLGTALVMILLIVYFAARAGRLTREVRLLWGIVPICMYCHSIRTEKNEWEKLEIYITRRSKAAFTHGICPPCQKKQLS